MKREQDNQKFKQMLTSLKEKSSSKIGKLKEAIKEKDKNIA